MPYFKSDKDMSHQKLELYLFGVTSLSIRFLKQIIFSESVDTISGTSKKRFEYSFSNFAFISSVRAFLYSGLHRTTVSWGGENILKIYEYEFYQILAETFDQAGDKKYGELEKAS